MSLDMQEKVGQDERVPQSHQNSNQKRVTRESMINEELSKQYSSYVTETYRQSVDSKLV